MSYKVQTIPRFDKDLKRLSKKYPSLKAQYADLIQALQEQPTLGTPLGNNCYKIRIAIASAGKGKRGGGRVITNVLVHGQLVYLLTMYAKNEAATIDDKELMNLLESLPELPDEAADPGRNSEKDK